MVCKKRGAPWQCPPQKKDGKRPWLDQGFNLLKTSGAQALTIENLTRGLDRTKGAFYHHFKNREDYSRSLLELWEERQANEIIRASKQKNTFQEINQTLVDLSEKAMDPVIEVAIRAWAVRDPLAREFQERIDRRRVEFLQEMFALNTGDQGIVDLFSMIRYCFYIGSHQIIPGLDEGVYKKHLAALMEMFELYTEKNQRITP